MSYIPSQDLRGFVPLCSKHGYTIRNAIKAFNFLTQVLFSDSRFRECPCKYLYILTSRPRPWGPFRDDSFDLETESAHCWTRLASAYQPIWWAWDKCRWGKKRRLALGCHFSILGCWNDISFACTDSYSDFFSWPVKSDRIKPLKL